MEMSQGNQCVAILNIQNINFLNKNIKQESRTGFVWGIGTSGRGRCGDVR
jgi:hypothetical protein